MPPPTTAPLPARCTEREEFVRALHHPVGDPDNWDRVCATFPAAATAYYLSLANACDPGDPILRQCVPDEAELAHPEAPTDPLAERRDSPVPGLVHRYPDRVLLVVTNTCAVHCRHCLRKRIWNSGESETLTTDGLERAVAYLLRRTEVREALLSGGDPLTLADAALEHYLARLRAIPHLEILRVGTRMPVVLPDRITDRLCRVFAAYHPVWVATQFNHPAELTAAAGRACGRLLRHGVPVVNQTVLLRGVNDAADTLESLFRGLLRFGVKPYYLFHGDPVGGTLHFRTGVRAGLEIMDRLRHRLSGLALPTFALDLPGGAGKVVLTPETPVRDAPGGVELDLADGTTVHYPDHDVH